MPYYEEELELDYTEELLEARELGEILETRETKRFELPMSVHIEVTRDSGGWWRWRWHIVAAPHIGKVGGLSYGTRTEARERAEISIRSWRP